MITTTEARKRRGARAERWGVAAEAAAADWYARRGGEIVARRVRTEAAELDLVVREGDALVFVEVKARRNIEAALGAVRPADWARIGNGAELYAERIGASGGEMRIDLFAMDRGGRIEVVPNAPLAGAL